MKCRRSAVSTTVAALPAKLVRYRMFGSEVTTSASRERAAQAARTVWWRRLSASDGACDMDGGEPRFECGQRADDVHVLVLADRPGPARGRDLDVVQLVYVLRDRVRRDRVRGDRAG